MVRPADLIYGLNDRPPLGQALFVAMQHVLAVFVGIITPPLIISRSLNLSAGDSGFLVSMALFISGIGTLIQTRRLAGGIGIVEHTGNQLCVPWPDHFARGRGYGAGRIAEKRAGYRVRSLPCDVFGANSDKPFS